ncbi:MAG: type II toxin-antitoxin system HicB family antitoxin [Armatimonadetes bacterium]|nr:type II toxin-antitoxin system HicB family antitoxin [Armatimonadota bacterium]
MIDSLEYFLRLTYLIEVMPDQSTEGSLCYIALCPELPGCMSHGDTKEEAMKNLSDAKELYIRTLLEKGQDIPLPKSLISTIIWDICDYSGGSGGFRMENEDRENLNLFPISGNPIKSI